MNTFEHMTTLYHRERRNVQRFFVVQAWWKFPHVVQTLKNSLLNHYDNNVYPALAEYLTPGLVALLAFKSRQFRSAEGRNVDEESDHKHTCLPGFWSFQTKETKESVFTMLLFTTVAKPTST